MRRPFGPDFFLVHLARFIRDRCPDPSEQLPRVDIRAAGEPLTVSHVIAVVPSWVALAVRDRHDHDAEMRTELIPYETISRVTVGAAVARSRGIGLDSAHRPAILEKEQPMPAAMLLCASQPACR